MGNTEVTMGFFIAEYESRFVRGLHNKMAWCHILACGEVS